MSIGDYVAWLVWCPDCKDVHHISHIHSDDHGRTDPERAWQRLADKVLSWGL